MLGMFLVGRLVHRFDLRLIMACGLVLTAYSLWQMTQFSLLMDFWPVVTSGVIQGLGVGLVYVPLAAVAFTTLPSHLRNEGTAFFNLLRNLGSSIGISVVLFLFTRNTQRLHASMVTHVTPYNVDLNPAVSALHLDLWTTKGAAALNGIVTNQSAMIAYIDDFRLMMVMTLLTIPLLLLIKNAKPAEGTHSAVLE